MSSFYRYCMSHCRHIMQSVELPAVTNARASGDYHPGGDQWAPLGTTGIFAWAVAIAPTKDNYWSTDVQRGSSYKDYETVSEPYNRLQAAVSTLSKGPVAASDKIGASDAVSRVECLRPCPPCHLRTLQCVCVRMRA